jgi:dTDP-glucose 4,6-dehydratase
VSTDEVYGSLGPGEPPFREDRAYAPNSPYAASKAASDHMVRAFHSTWGLPVVTTNCSNNYGPFQFPEKLLPLCLHKALAGEDLPVYGDGLQVRDWLHVADHCAALRLVLDGGTVGTAYNVGGSGEMTNLAAIETLCAILDELAPRRDAMPHAQAIRFVADRPGHDRRYAVDAGRIARELGWAPRVAFADGLAATVRWYLDNADWVARVTSGAYRDWLQRQYGS